MSREKAPIAATTRSNRQGECSVLNNESPDMALRETRKSSRSTIRRGRRHCNLTAEKRKSPQGASQRRLSETLDTQEPWPMNSLKHQKRLRNEWVSRTVSRLAMVETITVSSKGQITIPSKIRKELRIEKGGKFLVFREGDSIRITPVPKLSKLAGIDEQVFKGRKPSKEIETVRKEWTKEFEKHIIKQRIILDTRPLVRLLPKEAGRSTDIRRDRS